MPCHVAFLFSGTIDSTLNQILLSALLQLDPQKYTPIVLVKDPKGVFTQKIIRAGISPKIFTGELIEPTTGRFKGVIQTFKQSFGILGVIGTLQLDAIVSAELKFLVPFAPGAFLGKKPLFWIQDCLWSRYPIAEMWSGYTKLFYTTDSTITASLPKHIRKKARMVAPPSLEMVQKNPAFAKNYLESLFKDCI